MHHPFIICGGLCGGWLRHRKLHHRKWKGGNFPRFLPVFPAFFSPVFPACFFLSGTPLDYRYEQWNCESSLYRVTIDLLPPYVKPFSPPDLCNQPWLIDSVVCVCNLWQHFLCSFVCLVFSWIKCYSSYGALHYNKTPSTFSKLYW
jgi:hypothetical protein